MNSTSHASPDSAYASLVPVFAKPATASSRRSCETRTFRSKREALTARRTPFLRRRHRPEDYRPCPCAHCHGWHLNYVRRDADEV